MAVDGDVALSAGTDERSAELDLGGVIDVVEVDAIVVSHEEMVTDKGEVGVDRAGVDRGTAAATATGRGIGRWSGRRSGFRGVGVGRESGRLLETGDFLQSEDRLAGVEQAGLEANAGIVRAGARVGVDARGRRLGGVGLRPPLRSAERGYGDGYCERETGAKTAGISS